MSGEAVTTGQPGAATAATETVSAERVAAESGNVTAFLDADRQARSGKRPEPVTRQKPAAEAVGTPGRPNAPAAGKDGAAAKGPSAADRDADERLTARIREAVDTSTAELKRQNEELRQRLEGVSRQPAKPAEAAPTGEPAKKAAADEYKRYQAMTDAPQIEDYDSVTDYAAQMSVFIARTMHNERQEAERTGTQRFQQQQQKIERVKTFHGRINEWKTANEAALVPAADGRKVLPLSAEVGALHGFDTLQARNAEREKRGEQPLPATVDHAIAEEMYDSKAPAQMAIHLSTHPEALATLRAAANPKALERAFWELERTVLGAGAAGAPPQPDKQQPTAAELKKQAETAVDRSVSTATPPSKTVGKPGSQVDPFKKAVEDGDVGMFLSMDRERMIEQRGLRR